MLGQMYPRQKYVPAPLYFGKVYFPEINSRVERKGEIVSEMVTKLKTPPEL